ncbi:MAG: PD-(D/E)XK nuclease family protein [Planctomycetes bacterium]|nr:PD-(D/E)XK nuclease family protein [Planctomycetota bacterium]
MAIYSHSRLSNFEQCPRRYYYQYVARLKVEKEQTIEAFLGSRVHDAPEKLYRDCMCGKLLSIEQVVEHFYTDWRERLHEGIRIVSTEYSSDDYRRVGEECLRRYYAQYAPFDQSATLALEHRVVIDLDGSGKYKLQGYIDRLAQQSDGTIEIHDYKTNKTLPAQAEKDQDRQLALYQIGVQQTWPDASKAELVWHFLRHGRTIKSTRSPADLDRLKANTICLIDDIESRRDEADFQVTESALCDWCPFQQTCPARKHLFKTEALPTNRFLGEPGVALVDCHTALTGEINELKGKITSLDEQREQVVDALVAYANREGVTTVVGSSREARVTEQVKIVLPRKSAEPEEYAELDRCLRAGEAWPAVSSLDPHALRRIWKGDSDDSGDVRTMIEPFVTEESARQVRFRQRKNGNGMAGNDNSCDLGDKQQEV